MTTSWDSVYNAAKKAGAKFPELVAAQWALESARGTATSGVNNFFGIKGKGTVKPTWEVYNGKSVQVNAEFQDFKSPEECIQWLVDKWYKDYKGYKGVNYNSTAEAAAKDLVKQGYATDPNYATKLIKLMQENGKPAPAPAPVPSPTPAPTPAPVGPSKPIPPDQPAPTGVITAEKFVDFFRYFDDHNPNHLRAAALLYAQLPDGAKMASSDWVSTFRSKPQPSPDNKPILTLAAPYFSQRKNYREPERTCFSTACAMLLEYLRPGTLKATRGVQLTDSYLDYVFSIGDTTDASVQVRTLAHFGVQSRFVTNGTHAMLDAQLKKGVPIPVAILHHGPPTKPYGGHWILIIGKVLDSKAPGGFWYVVNDPQGELNHANGTYADVSGKGLKYSKNILTTRWTVEGDGSGWAIVAQGS
jgi:hypothetical protein